jgi:YfiH family protein
MSFHELNGLRYYSFEIFPDTVSQAVFTRRGGISPAPWHSLNLGGAVGDDPACVAANRLRIFNAMQRSPVSIHDVWLVHGTDIIYADHLRPLNEPSPKADIIFTNNPEVTLFMRFADCVPILFHDPVKKVIGIAHAGWTGTLRGVVGSAVKGMHEHYGCDPKNISAGIGPSICVDHYEVGEDVISQFGKQYPRDIEKIVQTKNGRKHMDLWTANTLQLKDAGVDKIQVSGVCTACHLEDWFSHRAEKGRTGRFGALMSMQV